MKKSLIALAGAMVAQASVACEPSSPGAVTFDDVATGTYSSLYVPGQVIIPATRGKTFSIEQADGSADCPLGGRFVAYSVSGDDLREISFHPVVRDATRVSFDYAKTPGTDAGVIVLVGGAPTGWITLDAASGHFAFDAPPGRTVSNFGVYARHVDGEGHVRIDNVVLNQPTVKE